MTMRHTQGSAPRRVQIEKAWLDIVDIDSALDVAFGWLKTDTPRVVMAINPEKVRAIGEDPMLEKFNRDAGLAIGDGMGVVIAAKLMGYREAARVTGIDFCEGMVARCAREDVPVFFYGAAEGVANDAARELQQRFPGLKVAGIANGFVPPERQDELVNTIATSGAEVLLVALGSPRQELWMNKNLGRLGGVRIVQGVGGSFDVFSGRLKRAPKAWQNAGLEWLYRLLAQPSRLPRYFRLRKFVPVLWRCAVGKGKKVAS